MSQLVVSHMFPSHIVIELCSGWVWPLCHYSGVAQRRWDEILKMYFFEDFCWKFIFRRPWQALSSVSARCRATLGPEKRPSLPVLILLAAALRWIFDACLFHVFCWMPWFVNDMSVQQSALRVPGGNQVDGSPPARHNTKTVSHRVGLRTPVV